MADCIKNKLIIQSDSPRMELIPREDIEYIRKEAESLLKEKGIDTKNKDSVER